MEIEALAKALAEGHLGGAAIDVYPWEPEKNGDKFTTPLQGLINVLLTPHIGYVTAENYNIIYTQMIEDLEACTNGKPIRVIEK